MTTELTMLTLSAVMCLLLPNVGILALPGVPGGFAWGLGNRDTPAPPGYRPGPNGRAARTPTWWRTWSSLRRSS